MKPNNAFKPVTSKQSITVQDEAYSEAMDEIAKLERICAKRHCEIGRLKAKIDRQIFLLDRALLALQKWNVRNRFTDLIDELRNAVK